MKIKLIGLALLLLSCSSDDVSDCNCEQVNYIKKIRMTGVTAEFYYQKSGSNPIGCQTETEYIQTSSNTFYRIECE
jgi:hypothetical protein